MRRAARLLAPVNWKYAIGELFLIVAGVLIAVAANAWWTGRQDARKELLYLQQLESDFASMDRELTNARNVEAQTTDASWRLLYATHGGRMSDETAGALFAQTATYAPVRIAQGTLLALIQTGDIGKIEPDSMRSRLVGFAGRLNQDLATLENLQVEILRQTAERNRFVDAFGNGPDIDNLENPFAPNWKKLFTNPAVNAYVNTSWSYSVRRWSLLNSLLRASRRLHDMILLELGRAPLPKFCGMKPAPASNPGDYSGNYPTDFGIIRVGMEADSLVLLSTSANGKLTALGRDTLCSESAETILTFTRDQAGRVNHMVMDQWGRQWGGDRQPFTRTKGDEF